MAFEGSAEKVVVLAAFDDHLRRVRGVCPEVRRTYARFAGGFLEACSGMVLLTLRVCRSAMSSGSCPTRPFAIARPRCSFW